MFGVEPFIVQLAMPGWKIQMQYRHIWWDRPTDKPKTIELRQHLFADPKNNTHHFYSVICQSHVLKYWTLWTMNCEVWSTNNELWSMKCEQWTVNCEVWSTNYELWSMKCEVWSVSCEVLIMNCEVWIKKCEHQQQTFICNNSNTGSITTPGPTPIYGIVRISNLDGAMNWGHKQTDLIIMDFAKAFDKVPQEAIT